MRYAPDLAHYCELLGHAEGELKTVQTRMIRDGFKGNAKDRVTRALRNVRKAGEELQAVQAAPWNNL